MTTADPLDVLKSKRIDREDAVAASGGLVVADVPGGFIVGIFDSSSCPAVSMLCYLLSTVRRQAPKGQEDLAQGFNPGKLVPTKEAP